MGKTTTEPPDSSKRIYGKLSAILGEVGNVPKLGWNDHFKYQYVKESDLSDAIRPLLAKYGIAIAVSVESVERIDLPPKPAGNDRQSAKEKSPITRVSLSITISDDTDTITAKAMGEAQDSGDKGIYKAITGAMKYWLYKTFLIGTGDDPEQTSDADKLEAAAKLDPETQKRQAAWDEAQQIVAKIQQFTDAADFEGYVADNSQAWKTHMYRKVISDASQAQRTKLTSMN